MSFLLSCLGFFQVLSVQVQWFDYFLTIELFENIEEYKEIPRAKLYIDGALVIDSAMYYERDGVERTFFSVIGTNHVKTYTIKYRVVFPSYLVTHVQNIVFDIVDLTAPTVSNIPEFRIRKDEKLPDFTHGLVYFDNYDDTNVLTVDIDATSVVLNQVGTYEIIYHITDSSGNVTRVTGFLDIYDHLAPIITQKKAIVISYQQLFIWQEFLTITDNDDLLPSVTIDDSTVDYEIIGTYYVFITATDHNGLSTVAKLELTIIDDIKPIITLKSQPLPILVFSDIELLDLSVYIVNIYDNYETLSKDDVHIWHDIESSVLGTYTIYFSIADSSGNRTEETLNIRVVDQDPPVIYVDVLVFDVFDPQPFFIDYIFFEDNYTTYNLLKLKITESVNMDVIGLYPITIEVTDCSGNKAVERLYVQILDRISPTISQINDILIIDFLAKDLHHYFEATDNYDDQSRLIIQIDDHTVDYETIGRYPILVYASDASGNIGVLETDLMIIDMIEPTLTLSQSTFYAQLFSEPIDPLQFVIEAWDNYDQLSISDVTYEGQVNYMKSGVYTIEYLLQDTSLNTTYAHLEVTIDDQVPPIITSSIATIYVNQQFNPLEGIKATDNDQVYTLDYFPKLIDTSIPGTQIITYVATDSRGNYTIHHREISILPQPKKIDMVSFVPVLLITILGGGACYYFYKRL